MKRRVKLGLAPVGIVEKQEIQQPLGQLSKAWNGGARLKRCLQLFYRVNCRLDARDQIHQSARHSASAIGVNQSFYTGDDLASLRGKGRE